RRSGMPTRPLRLTSQKPGGNFRKGFSRTAKGGGQLATSQYGGTRLAPNCRALQSKTRRAPGFCDYPPAIFPKLLQFPEPSREIFAASPPFPTFSLNVTAAHPASGGPTTTARRHFCHRRNQHPPKNRRKPALRTDLRWNPYASL